MSIQEKKDVNSRFDDLIDKEYYNDLIMIIRIDSLPKEMRNSKHGYFLGLMKYKYINGCPSKLYYESSEPLKREYDRLHRKIHDLLYKH